jgi:hypothetical protein
MPYFVGEPSPKEGQHHNSIKDLWELKWKKKVQTFNSSSVYDTDLMMKGHTRNLSIHGGKAGRLYEGLQPLLQGSVPGTTFGHN